MKALAVLGLRWCQQAFPWEEGKRIGDVMAPALLPGPEYPARYPLLEMRRIFHGR
jgi:hypothetical protein